ncbi:hypothetical protein ABEB36_004271 [Hypothenemus hampei]|uniref:Cytochrome P450 n=1 Tax=Hypothenemus hampei TaxID=57062 RepID=A0ABD1F3C6_HYPHA
MSTYLVDFFLLLFLFILVVLLIIYAYFQYSYCYWKSKGVPYLKPKFPLGNNELVGFEAYSYGIENVRWYQEFKKIGAKFGGAWSWATPVLLLTDPEYYKDVLVKDFRYFINRDFYHNPKFDPKNENLFVAVNEDWRQLRHKLSPIFTSAKMKMMYELVLKCSEPMMDRLRKHAKNNNAVDIREVVASFSTDVIGCVAFGLECKSFASEEAVFRKMGKEIFRSTPKSKLFLVLSRLCSDTAQKLGVNNIPEVVTQFFTEIITETIQYRQKNGIKIQDFLDLLIGLYESKENNFSFNDLIGNVILFFIAGFDTSSATMSCTLFELAKQPTIQNKVRDEIYSVLKKHQGKLTYDAFQEMTYLRQCIDETLRMYPPVQNLARFCEKPYKFKNSNLILDKGITVLISTVAVGRDPEYYPNPDLFDPERFNSANKAARNPFVYLPFGEGPRHCIGKRFGIMQSSIALINILKNYKISISPNSTRSITLKKGVFLFQSNETVYLNLEKVQ